MHTLSEHILSYSEQQPEGTPLTAKEFLHLGTRAAVDQALSRLVRRGKLMRSGRGIYVRPIKGRFGVRAPTPEKVIAEVAQLRGEIVAPSGSAAANALGLTTQVPMRLQYLTSGRNRQLTLGAQTIELKHAPAWQLTNANRQSGDVLRALAWSGRSHARETLRSLKNWLPTETCQELIASRSRLPGWVAEAISIELAA